MTDEFDLSDVGAEQDIGKPDIVAKPAKRRKKCENSEHKDVPVRASKRIRCSVCGDEFPCRGECDHFDCEAARTGPWSAFPLADPWLERPES